MGCGTEVRDTVETVASLAGNYELPGSSLITDNLVSKGSQKQLGSPIGKVAQIGTGLAGSGVGSGLTGIPESAGGALEGSILSGVGDAATKALGGATDFLGLTSGAGTGAGTVGTDVAAGGLPTGTGAGAGALAPSIAAPTAPVSISDLPDLTAGQVGGATESGLEGVSTAGGTNLGSITGATPTAAAPTSNLLPFQSATGGLDAGEQALLSNADTSAFTTNVSAPGLTAGIGGDAAKAVGGLIPGFSNKDLVSLGLPLANVAYQAIKGAPPLPSDEKPLQTGGAVTAPLINTETAGVNAYNTGTLTPSQQASVTKFVNDQTNMLIQQLANQGVTDMRNDSRYIQGIQQIQQQAIAMQQQLLQTTFQNALSAAGAASTNLANVANQQIQNDTGFQNALTGAMTALGGVAGGQPKNA